MNKNEIEEYLAKIRKAISESEALVEQAERRIAETDRFLSEHGITREQLRKIHPTEEQLAAVNAELERRGLPALDPLEEPMDEEVRSKVAAPNFDAELASGAEELENRKRKFGAMMQTYRL